MTLFPRHLPLPDADAKQHCLKLFDALNEKLRAEGGKISFQDFMQFALYAPGLGYYSAGATKFGGAGDFVTAPNLSPLFSKSLAHYYISQLDCLNQPTILEFGAGNGQMAADILLELHEQNSLPDYYFILEVSADLRERQQQWIQQKCGDLAARVIWLDRLPEKNFSGMIFANEVLDAMPVAKFHWKEGKLFEYFITLEQDHLAYLLEKPSELLQQTFEKNVKPYIETSQEYTSEINLLLPAWFRSISDFFESGQIVLIDYGFNAETYYHPQRNMGTLMCHYRHRAHEDPLVLLGLQDITAHVDFSFVIACAEQNQFSPIFFSNQANFLLKQGIERWLSPDENELDYFEKAQQLKYLLLPSEMGEIFKVLVLEKGIY